MTSLGWDCLSWVGSGVLCPSALSWSSLSWAEVGRGRRKQKFSPQSEDMTNHLHPLPPLRLTHSLSLFENAVAEVAHETWNRNETHHCRWVVSVSSLQN